MRFSVRSLFIWLQCGNYFIKIKGQLAASRWRSKYGRPAKLPKLGDVDPTGSYCALPEDWLMKKSGRKTVLMTFLS